MINVGIIDDNIQLTEVLEDYIATLEDMKVTGVAHNGLDGLDLIKREPLDLVILDLIMPHTDGLSLLEQLYAEKNSTKVLMLTAFGKEDIIKQASDYGASYYLMKPFELSHLSEVIRNICLKESQSINTQRVNEIKQNNKGEDLEVRISDVLRSIGIPANLKGYLFLREAIQMVIQNVDLLGGLGGITKIIYPTIAEKYHTTPSRVERAIRHSIEVGWNRGSIEVIEFVFGNTVSQLKVKPTNGKFIALIADYLRLKNSVN
jgi:two-component system, response regulator, stage 0 sporulation protein A